jgi:hypothetical protein
MTHLLVWFFAATTQPIPDVPVLGYPSLRTCEHVARIQKRAMEAKYGRVRAWCPDARFYADGAKPGGAR